ncbi:MAG: response regulator [Clostridiales bacterium]|nr:response regulator [Clostridiales bacterium]
MRILLAAPDRDLLECYKEILETDFGETVTAFDGAQVISLISSENFDTVILDHDLPLTDSRKLIERIRDKGIPVIVLINGSVSVTCLTEKVPATAYLSYPFTSDGIKDVIMNVCQKSSSGGKLTAGGVEIDVSGFRIQNGPYLTAGEIDVLQSLLSGGSVTTEDGAYISALNRKFSEIGAAEQIKYRPEKGFGLVTNNE